MKKLSSLSTTQLRPIQQKLETVLYVEDEDDNW